MARSIAEETFAKIYDYARRWQNSPLRSADVEGLWKAVKPDLCWGAFLAALYFLHEAGCLEIVPDGPYHTPTVCDPGDFEGVERIRLLDI